MLSPQSIGKCAFNRRDAIAGMCVCALSPFATTANAQSRKRSYCSDASVPTNGPSIALPEWKHDLAIWIRRDEQHLSDFFGTGGIIRILIGTDDAFANETGEIGLGERFLLRAGAKRLDQITAIIAHERAHIFQITFNVDRMLADVRRHRVKFIELHADYMAGSFFAWLQRRRRVDPTALASMFFDIGDTHFDSDRHHGTHQERYVAFANGFNQFNSASGVGTADVTWAASMGIKYVKTIL